MAYTHDYELKIGDTLFEGEVEINDAGVVSFSESINPSLPWKTKNAIAKVLDILSTLPVIASDLKKFELDIK